ncbi:hypothetical protein K432DRAFT_413907 [Lepidopterella palustris CBS 459.81]|uniref:Uncharacterized protein n=1 Tax=Lepidopterella palustris CBS 459.81 TaxID=1314670 RepID=A0A8E2JJF9_9PEZI|nr:hypothetical protein K432DRAFT_413907 [Lepidopterella palustris CBS 459.81]
MSLITRPGAGFSLEKRLVERPTDPDGLVLEAWAQGYMVGSLIIMSCITMANMRRGVILHKLLLGIWHGFWIFFHNPIYAWWLSVSAIFLNMSWSLHNVIAWMKIKPFLSRPASIIFIGTVILVQPYWVVEIYANFTYFHNINDLFLHTRPWEALCRDPWWIYTTVALFYNIKVRYELEIKDIIRISPRFGIMLGAMIISICFIILDVCAVTDALKSTLPVGINPFWKLSFVFKCLTDSVILDDFKTALDRLRAFKISRMGSFSVDNNDRRARGPDPLVMAWEEAARGPRGSLAIPSPDGELVHPSHNHWPGFKHDTHHVESVFPNHGPDLENQKINAEDMVPSALEDLAPVHRGSWGRKDGLMQMHGAGHLAEEGDYMRAIREMSTDSSATSPTKVNFSRPTLSP